MKFKSNRDYYQAIMNEIDSQSQHNEARAIELKRDYALERCMSRFDATEVAVKGGFGVRTLVTPSPLTMDVDVLIDRQDWLIMDKDKAYKLCAQFVVDAFTEENPDRFHFDVTQHGHIVDLRPDQALGKIWLQVRIGDIPFSSMQIDFGIKPEDTPLENHSGRDVLSFAGIDNPAITTASREYLAADKISLVLEQGSERPRDLVHCALLLEEGKYNLDHLKSWVEKLAKYRNVDQLLIAGLPEAHPEVTNDWIKHVDLITKRYRLNVSGQDCFDRVDLVLKTMFGRST